MNRIFISIVSISFLLSCKPTTHVSQVTNSTASQDYILSSKASSTYWQQHVDYNMEIDVDVNNYQYEGKQTLVYTNNSPDVLKKVFYHLYFNAFQPESEMDIRSRTIPDPDSRVGDRISKLKPNEIGYIHVQSLKQNGTILSYKTVGTVLEVDLAQPIQPGERVTFDMVFDAQVPVQIRRSGRNNSEGVALSMAQWYPKLAEYDYEGWHTDPYIGREFYGVWGNFDVKIAIDKNYTLGGTGYLQNPNEIGHGYETEPVKPIGSEKLTWHFIAPNVHDFTWAADPEYIHDTMQVPNGPLLHFLYKSTMPKDKLKNWKKLQPKTVELMQFYSENIGQYPYEQYSVIQGGDGGMEYGMCTLIAGEGEFNGLFGVTAHELAHSWFQFLLATNELTNYWMDEGFTEYFGELAECAIFNKPFEKPTKRVYDIYFSYAKSGYEQPQTTHADRFFLNQSSSVSAYYKGYIFLNQLSYIIGEENQKETIKQYFKEWAFKHPTRTDFIRIAEKVSGIHLDWYLNDWTRTTNTIDYGVKTVKEKTITLERRGLMPMPIDLTVTYTDGTTEDFYIPLQMMRGEKPTAATIIKDWAWAYPTYTFDVSKPVKSVEIDPKHMMADIDRENNKK
ncbi:M1 family metallopeptidase [Tamlana fucoidanivorans]|uniref:M1 family metallopeptidase n=1 Tax=Allotamlana fucoidanivorans TaxID=2583814 RepID=A0A5C4STZ8_9FLAO|nr:M1 family metallopeptidase [Tamlana fucoidanivorans]TNJ47101.1 M1 family metallopeptidase [Tamlana fucoidanivorans]